MVYSSQQPQGPSQSLLVGHLAGHPWFIHRPVSYRAGGGNFPSPLLLAPLLPVAPPLAGDGMYRAQSYRRIVPCRRGQLSVAAPPGPIAQQTAPLGRRRNVSCRIVRSYRALPAGATSRQPSSWHHCPLWSPSGRLTGIPSGRAGPDGGRRRLSVNRKLLLFNRNRPPVPLGRGEAAEASQKNQIASREIQYFASRIPVPQP